MWIPTHDPSSVPPCRPCALTQRCPPSLGFTDPLGEPPASRQSNPSLSRWLSVLIGAWLLGTSVTPHAGEPSPPPAPARLDRYNLLLYRTPDGQTRPVHSTKEWGLRRQEVKAGLEQVMGKMPGNEKQCDLDPRVEEEVDCGTYVRRFLTYASEPGSRVPAYLLIPKRLLGGRGSAPGILCLHQTHALGQKVVVGLGQSPNDEYGVELVERGFVCLAPAYPLLANYAPDWRKLGYESASMKAIWDNRRGLDLLDRLPFVKRGRYATIGHSLGGHNSVFTAVFDDRIRVVVSSCGLDSFLDYMGGNVKGWTGDRYMPNLGRYAVRDIPFDFHELIASLAPRPCLISAPIGDTNFRWESVDRVAGAARQIYGLYRVPENLIVEHPDCGHKFPKAMRESAYALIEKTLGRPR